MNPVALPIACGIDGRALTGQRESLLAEVLGTLGGAALGPNLAVNGGFASGANWTLGPDTVIASGLLTHTPGASNSDTTQLLSTDSLTQGVSYRATFTISGYTAGTVSPFLLGTGKYSAVALSGNGPKTIDIVMGVSDGGNDSCGLEFSATFNGNIDNYALQQIL